MKPINILHISDIHAGNATIDKLKLRIKTFLNDIDQYKGNIDLIFVTGDISLEGKYEQFKLAEDIIFNPLLKRLQLSKNKIFITPGNHDVDRSNINRLEDAGVKQFIKNDNDSSKYYMNKTGFNRFGSYNKFINEFYNIKDESNSKVVEIHNIQVGIGVINSAWRCSGKDDKENLCLSEFQISEVSSILDNSMIKIGIMHHPESWFSDNERRYVIPELKRQFDIIVTGHLHENISRGDITPQYNTILLTAPSLYNHYCDQFLGYNLYSIDISNKKLVATYKKYMKLRNDFDRDTEYAQNGEYAFDFNTKLPSTYSTALLCQKITALNTKIEESMKKQLSLYQQLPDPILVTPRISQITWKGADKIKTPFKGDPSNFTSKHAFLYAPKDMGKSILMKSAMAKINQIYFVEKKGSISSYIDLNFKDIPKINLIEMINKDISDISDEAEFDELIIFIDHINTKCTVQLSSILEIITEQPRWKFIVTLENELIIETVSKNKSFNDWEFYELMPWGPSRIREFIEKYFEASDTDINIDAAYNFICHSLKNTDLPCTPVVITLYLSVFPYLENQVSSISFLHLLEKIEQQRIGSTGGAPQKAFYNKQLILANFAALCLKKENITVTKDETIDIINKYFNEISLKADAEQVLKDFVSSGILQLNEGGYEFTLFIFYDYYIAKACEKGILSIDKVYNEIHYYINLGQALALLSGMKRSDNTLISKIISDIEPHFDDYEYFNLEKLDKYISHLLYSPSTDTTADTIVENCLEREIDYDEADKEFDEQKALYRQERFEIEKLNIETDQLQKISVKTLILKTLYNSFRNLENLKTDQKLIALNKILELHISCNINLIDFYKKIVSDDVFDSLIAYLTTIGGQSFLSKNIGSQSLELIINKYMDNINNDFKKLLVVLLYSDLRLPKYGQKLEEFIDETDSRAAIEILYYKIRALLISHSAPSLPQALISAFKAAYEKREKKWSTSKTGGNIKDKFVKVLEDTKRDHLIFYNRKDNLKILRDID